MSHESTGKMDKETMIAVITVLYQFIDGQRSMFPTGYLDFLLETKFEQLQKSIPDGLNNIVTEALVKALEILRRAPKNVIEKDYGFVILPLKTFSTMAFGAITVSETIDDTPFHTERTLVDLMTEGAEHPSNAKKCASEVADKIMEVARMAFPPGNDLKNKRVLVKHVMEQMKDFMEHIDEPTQEEDYE